MTEYKEDKICPYCGDVISKAEEMFKEAIRDSQSEPCLCFIWSAVQETIEERDKEISELKKERAYLISRFMPIGLDEENQEVVIKGIEAELSKKRRGV